MIAQPMRYSSTAVRFPLHLNIIIRACEYAHESSMNHNPLKVLILFEESQAECLAFRELGHEAFSCDLQAARYKPEYHVQGDARLFLGSPLPHNFITQDGLAHSVSRWDLVIAHPPCTYLCKVSAVHMVIDGQLQWSRFRSMILARRMFMKCLYSSISDYLLVENPLPMKRAHLPAPSFYASPHWYGVKYSKKTLYWARGLPPLMPTCFYPNPKCYVTCSRGKYRSRTFPELARAIARQYSDYILSVRHDVRISTRPKQR